MFLTRRPKEELRVLVGNVDLPIDFENLWDRAIELFDDDLPLVSLDAFLYVHTGVIEHHVGQAVGTIA